LFESIDEVEWDLDKAERMPDKNELGFSFVFVCDIFFCQGILNGKYIMDSGGVLLSSGAVLKEESEKWKAENIYSRRESNVEAKLDKVNDSVDEDIGPSKEFDVSLLSVGSIQSEDRIVCCC
jgi:hypothetical protein